MKKISVRVDAFVKCKSCYYSTIDSLNCNSEYTFIEGVNLMTGEIDSGVWGVSYLISMYTHRIKDCVLLDQPYICVDNNMTPLSELSRQACYLDPINPMFATRKTVKKMISHALNSNQKKETVDEIRKLFQIDHERFERPLSGTGNEIYKAMAAIAYANNMRIYCFPWFSQKRFEGFHNHINDLVDILERVNKVVILPIGK